MKYIIENEEYQVEVIKKNNKNSYIRCRGNIIYVTTNVLTTKKMIEKILIDNHKEIKKMLFKSLERQEKNEDFYYLGIKYNKIVVPTLDEVFFTDKNIFYKNDKQLQKYIEKNTFNIFEERLKVIYNLFDEHIPYPVLKIRNMKSRWGVCNRKFIKITLNSLLIRYDINCIDYVLIHELAHFIHFDHSKNFWNLVSKYCNNYKEIRRILNN